MNKIQSREYTSKENGRLKPTEIGCVIALLLENNFQQIMNIDFTAHMEDDLELVAEKQKDWKVLIREFWEQFAPTLATAEKEAFVPKVLTDIDCPTCGAKLQKVWFKSKYFYGCSKYPDCNYTAPIEELSFNKDDYAEDFNWEQKCPKCSADMKVRHGKFGAFLGCTTYPECKGIVNIPKKGEEIISQENMPACPALGCVGSLTARKSRFGKTFYSCSTFPECDVIVNSLDQLPVKYANHPRTAYVKSEKKGRRGAKPKPAETKEKATKKVEGASKKTAAKKKSSTKAKSDDKPKKPRKSPAQHLSPELSAIVGTNELPRGEVTKKVWDYIKSHSLQDPENKRLIRPDANLSKVFGSTEPIDMFKLAGILNKHFS